MVLSSLHDLTKSQRNAIERRFAFAKADDDSHERKLSGVGRAGSRSVETRQLTKLMTAIDGCGPAARDLIQLNDPGPWRHVENFKNGPTGRSLLEQLRVLTQTAIQLAEAQRGRPRKSRYQEAALLLATFWDSTGERVVIGAHPNAARVKGASPLVEFVGRCFLELEPELKTLSAARTRARTALLALRKSGQLRRFSSNTSPSRRRL